MGSCASIPDEERRTHGTHSTHRKMSGADSKRSSHALSSSSGGAQRSRDGPPQAAIRQQHPPLPVKIPLLTEEEIEQLFYLPRSDLCPKDASAANADAVPAILDSWIQLLSAIPSSDKSSNGSVLQKNTAGLTEAELECVCSALRVKYHDHIAPEVKQHCGGDQNKWMAFFVKQLVLRQSYPAAQGPTNSSIAPPRTPPKSRVIAEGGGLLKQPTLIALDELFDDVYFRQVSEAETSSAAATGSIPMLEVASDRQSETVSASSIAMDAGTTTGAGSERGESPSSRPSLSPGSPVKTFTLSNSDAIEGTYFAELMSQLGISDDLHFLYLCSKLVAPQLTPDGPLPQLRDQWRVSRLSWRAGWISSGALTTTDQLAFVKSTAREINEATISSPAFRKLYRFLWTFTAAAPSSNNDSSTNRIGATSVSRKSMPKEQAVQLWESLFPPHRWPLITAWLQFLQDPQTTTGRRQFISSDVWLQLQLFAQAMTSDTDIASHNSASSTWPSAFDEFVDWLKQPDSRTARTE